MDGKASPSPTKRTNLTLDDPLIHLREPGDSKRIFIEAVDDSLSDEITEGNELKEKGLQFNPPVNFLTPTLSKQDESPNKKLKILEV
jgi:hypothetical protein